jgi:hypothetical protein
MTSEGTVDCRTSLGKEVWEILVVADIPPGRLKWMRRY